MSIVKLSQYVDDIRKALHVVTMDNADTDEIIDQLLSRPGDPVKEPDARTVSKKSPPAAVCR